MATADHAPHAAHIPVLIDPLIDAVAPVSGVWLDGTFGNGGYTRRLVEAGASHVHAVDRDPLAEDKLRALPDDIQAKTSFHATVFSRMDEVATGLDGIVLDLGVSSMQLDQAERGFSFLRDGPLDMRMSQEGETAADLIDRLDEQQLAGVIYTYGEEKASRRIARAIKAAGPLTRTGELAEIVERCLPRAKPGQSHPATRTFQALRIAVNDEYGELYQGLMAAERALKEGGFLAVVTFHSIEDRMVKRFLQARAGRTGNANRYAPEAVQVDPQFELVTRKAVGPSEAELARNPRSRSARLRVARRTGAAAGEIDAKSIATPLLKGRD
ncbi:16S rRNA (cytosine(1402)-N(4))-methyltransferase RsmH [Primorskyibacter sp. S187A]|uniref:16S rRNA (cytosine(1402)-N(4))-methyltransferase RsmH n=1 Tax=Primorskyibacter sp. S187A TaxID=3415130 RepID=UPI003C7DB4BE